MNVYSLKYEVRYFLSETAEFLYSFNWLIKSHMPVQRFYYRHDKQEFKKQFS